MLRKIQLIIAIIFIAINSIAQFQDRIFSNSVIFEGTGSLANWVVPANINTIGMELWGAGGSGTPAGGGQGGGYLKVIIAVTPGQRFDISVGIGNDAAKKNSSVQTTFGTASGFVMISAIGGADGGANNAGGYSVPFLNRNVLYKFGLHGEFAKPVAAPVYQYVDANRLVKTFTGARGGNGGNTIGTGAPGGFYMLQYNPNAAIAIPQLLENIIATKGNIPGGGGGGSLQYGSNLSIITLPGGVGGNGKIIIYY